MADADPLSLIPRRLVEKKTGLSRSPLYARIKSGTFPRPVRLSGSKAVRWVEQEVDRWVSEQIRNSRKPGESK